MKTTIAIFLLFIIQYSILNNQSKAQAPVIDWQKCFGGSANEYANSIQQTTGGGYIVAGYSGSNDGDVSGNHGMWDYWLIKLDSSGIIQWQKCLGGDSADYALSIQQTTDGGYIVAGYSSSNDSNVSGNHGSNDYWIVKLNSLGIIQWKKCLGGSNDDRANSIQQTTDSGYIVAGFTYSNDGDVSGNHGSADYWIVKLDSSGSIQWQKCLGGSNDDVAESIQQTTDSGYIVAGYTSSNDGDVSGNHGWYDYWLIKLDSSGIIQWQKCLGGSESDEAHSIQQTIDGGYIVAGMTESNDGDVSGNHGIRDYWIVKLDSSGSIQWQKCHGGSYPDVAISIQQTTDSGYIVAGVTYSNDGDVSGNHGFWDYWIVKLDSSGIIQWQKCLGGSDDDYGYSIQQTTDDGYIVAGHSYSNNGDVSGNYGLTDYWIVKLKEFPVGIESNKLEYGFSIYPNPSKGIFNIVVNNTSNEKRTIKITNVIGKVVYNREFEKTERIFEQIDLSGLAKGIYFISAFGGKVYKIVMQ